MNGELVRTRPII
uniref:Uncharacterized protein n=1 Tax=Rhizophora mucronata TaxID=61149 RepID=A0A2P2MAS1_RHIMU